MLQDFIFKFKLSLDFLKNLFFEFLPQKNPHSGNLLCKCKNIYQSPYLIIIVMAINHDQYSRSTGYGVSKKYSFKN